MEELVLNFYCPCGEKSTTIFRNQDMKDSYHCSCGRIWLVIRPIDIRNSCDA